MPAGFGYGSRPEEISTQSLLERARAIGASIRTIVELTGVSFGAIQGALSGRTTPRPATVARIEAGLADVGVFRTQRERTFADDALLWSGDELANLTPPVGSRNVKLILESPNTETGFASTRWYPTATSSPLDVLIDVGADPRVVRRVIWER